MADIVFSTEIPWIPPRARLKWLGNRLFGRMIPAPSGLLVHDLGRHEFTRHAIVSSRLSAVQWCDSAWWRKLRDALLAIQKANGVVVTADGCATDRVLSALPDELRLPMIRFVVRGRQSLQSRSACQSWISATNRWIESQSSLCRQRQILLVVMSPEFTGHSADLANLERLADTSSESSSFMRPPATDCLSLQMLPVADRVCFAAAKQLHVLKFTEQGNISSLIHHRLNDPELPPGTIHRCALQSVSVRTQRTTADRNPSQVATPASAMDDLCQNPQDWLCHWTRGSLNRWPDEAAPHWVARMLSEESCSERNDLTDALKTLIRIVEMNRLLGSPRANRGRHSVVCFTEVPLSDFRLRRVYRRHLRRFDFEPYGIAIRKDALMNIGARPVIYGSDQVWNTLPPADRPFFQRTPAALAPAGKTLDFSEEREWRVPHEIDLTQLNPIDVRIFVNEPDEETHIPASPFKIVVVPP